jgi:hypothetical protein
VLNAGSSDNIFSKYAEIMEETEMPENGRKRGRRGKSG